LTKEHRKYRRNPTGGKFRIQTSLSSVVHTVSLKEVSKNGAFIHTLHLPARGEKITFEILDDYGLKMVMGSRFDDELDQAMLDYLYSLQTGETASIQKRITT